MMSHRAPPAFAPMLSQELEDLRTRFSGFSADLTDGGRMVPGFGFDPHPESRVVGGRDRGVLGSDGRVEHRGPVAFIKALAALLNPHVRGGGSQVRGRIKE